MTPKEKAEELIEKFKTYADPYHHGRFYNTKQCALIAVHEVLEVFNHMPSDIALHFINYWQEVKQEIELL